MNEQIRKAFNSIKKFWANASKKLKRGIVISIIVVVVAALFLSIFINSKDYVVIFDQLAETETTEILAKLQEMGVSAKLDGDDSVMVLKEDEDRVRMALATEGYPKSGLSYYLIEKGGGMLTTDYERKQYANMQLQERIAACIKTLNGVKDAVVTITVPDEKVFYLEEEEQATASVVVHMKQGQALEAGQIAGIQNLVAKSVTGLTKDNIALVDSEGNDLAGNRTNDSPDYLKVSLTREIENEIKKKIYTVLDGPYDSLSFKISVTADIDTDGLVREETLYTPSLDGDNTGVVSENSTSSESSSSTQGDGGVAGTSSNSEIPTYPAGSNNGESTSSSSNQNTKYKVSEVKSQSQKSGAKINSISIGIAIDKGSFEPGEKENITELVAFAAGVNPDNITVQNFDFYKGDRLKVPDKGDGGNRKIIYISIGTGIFLLLAGILAFVLLRKKKRSKQEMDEYESQGDKEDPMDELFGQTVSVEHIEPVENSRRTAVKEFAHENPEIVAQMIKSWLKSDNE